VLYRLVDLGRTAVPQFDGEEGLDAGVQLLLAAEREAQMPIAKPHHQRQCSPAFTDSVLMPLAQDQMQVLR
jgi:hypothetical protein